MPSEGVVAPPPIPDSKPVETPDDANIQTEPPEDESTPETIVVEDKGFFSGLLDWIMGLFGR
jgi:hypothetical protein